MHNTLFNRYRQLAAKAEVTLGTKESLEWFRKRIRKDSNIKNHDRVTKNLRKARPGPGKMMTYVYDPKYKEKLKYYDNYPLIIMLDLAKGGWYGANLHYLPPTMRVELLEAIEYKKIPLGRIAKALESNPITKLCLKRYLAKQVMSPPVNVPKDECEIAIQLPFESFTKASVKEVWRDTKRGS